MNITQIKTLGQLKAAGYIQKNIKDELRHNLMQQLNTNSRIFKSIIGYDDTVIPDIERAILSRHNILFLGLRGQAKTRIARLMVQLLDEYMPIITGSDLNDSPFYPISHYGQAMVKKHGDNTPISWLHRRERYTEKLATPDVTVSDLIGDVDPIKAATLKLPYSDPRVIHFGLVPRSHRCIFVINELPDLQARIQVSLFNILQESDIQIRGFKTRLPLDIQFVFTANPEDYTNRGSIVTPLKDRIESQITTHYPINIKLARQITEQEADLPMLQQERISFNEISKNLIEQIAFEARQSEYVDAKSGVSARLTITAFENLASAAERRMLRHGEEKTYVRLGDFWGVIPAITGKIELVYEGEQEGAHIVAQKLISQAIRTEFTQSFPDPETFKRKKRQSPYQQIIAWFGAGNVLDVMGDVSNNEYAQMLYAVPGLIEAVRRYFPQVPRNEKLFLMEFILHGLAEYSLLSKTPIQSGFQFKDLFNSMIDLSNLEDLGEEDSDDEEEDFF